MRIAVLAVLFSLLCISTWASVWSPEDREIFALRDAVEQDVGEGTTFYSWLGISKSASDTEITKAYRKMSRKLHPDKNPGQTATERFARLGVVANVLRSARRDRYDFYLGHGFPKLTGSDYSYKRYRPSLIAVIIFLYFLAGAAQYIALRITATRDRAYMQGIIDEVTAAAWGNGISSTKRKVNQPNGKSFVIYPTGSVFLVQNDVEFWLNPDDIKLPTWRDTVIAKLPQWIITKTTGYKFRNPSDGSILGSDKQTEEITEKATEKATEKEKVLKPRPVVKTGGVRRKRL